MEVFHGKNQNKLGAGARLADYLTVGYLALNRPLERVRQTLVDCGAQSQRRRGLSHEVLVYDVMCRCLYRRAAYEELLRIVVEGLRGVYGEEIGQTLVNKAAIAHMVKAVVAAGIGQGILALPPEDEHQYAACGVRG